MSATAIAPLPTIEKAVRLMAYDNGMVNREDPDPISRAMEVLRRELNIDFLLAAEEQLAALSGPALDTACTGENEEREALGLPTEASDMLDYAWAALIEEED